MGNLEFHPHPTAPSMPFSWGGVTEVLLESQDLPPPPSSNKSPLMVGSVEIQSGARSPTPAQQEPPLSSLSDRGRQVENLDLYFH